MNHHPPISLDRHVEQLRAELAAKDRLLALYRQAANDLDALITEGRVTYHPQEGNIWSLMLNLGWPQGPEETTHELVLTALRALHEQREQTASARQAIRRRRGAAREIAA